MQITTIGLDIAKNVFQVHGIDAAEKVVVRKQLRRSRVLEFFKALPPCLIGMAACATAHYWARVNYCKPLKENKAAADSRVERALYRRGCRLQLHRGESCCCTTRQRCRQ